MGKKTFKLNPIQTTLLNSHWKRNIILKARQLGITTFSVIDMLDDVLFKSNFSAVLIAHHQQSMEEIFSKVKLAWDEFPPSIKAHFGWEVFTDNKNQLKFNNGSSITLTLSSRSGTVNRLHISELGKIAAKYPEKATEIFTGAIPSVVPGGRIDIESTAEGSTGLFYETYQDALKNPNPVSDMEFKPFFFPWTLDPDYEVTDEKLGYDFLPKDIMAYGQLHHLSKEKLNFYFLMKKTQKELMKREFPTTDDEAFEGSGQMIFDQNNISRRLAQDVMAPEKVGDWNFYEKYIPGHRYGMGCDVAEGIGRDHCAVTLWDFSNKEGYTIVPKVVATYKSNRIDPLMFALEIKNVAIQYGSPIVAVERNNHGYATIGKLKEIYTNIFKEVKTDRESIVETDRYGWHTTQSNKPEIILNLKNAINQDEIIIPDKPLLIEMKTYGTDELSSMKFNPEVSNHFDLLMSAAIGFEMRNYASGSKGLQTQVQEEFDEYSVI